MANTVSILSYANTFGDLVTTLNAVSKENNDFAANNFTKPTGTLFLNDPNLSLQVANNAVIQGGLQVQGIGSSAYVQNNLRVDRQVYFTNTALSLTANGQANIGGPLYALASANSIIASNNVTVGGNTFVVGSIFGANNLTIQNSTQLNSTTLINGRTTVANSLSVSAGVGVVGSTYTDKLVGNTSTFTPTSYVTGLLDAGLATSQLHIVTANNLTATQGYINNLQANTKVNTALLTATTIQSGNSNSEILSVNTTFSAANASGLIKNLQVTGDLTIDGNFLISGETVYTSNTFTLNSGAGSGQTSTIVANRGVSSAEIRWNEPSRYWDINNVDTGYYYKILTREDITNSLTSTSTDYPASASAANALNTLITNANTALRSSIVTAGNYANAAFAHANASFESANNVFPQIQPAWNTANAAFVRANTSLNTINGTNGQVTPNSGAISFFSNNGIQVVAASNTFYVNTPQDIRSTASPTFSGLTLSNALPVTQGGTGAQSSLGALQNILPSTIGVPSGYVLSTTGGGGATFSWAAGGTGGGGGTQPGTRIVTNRLFYTASGNQTEFTTPTYTTGSGQLRVYVNGVRQYNADYTETSTTSVTLTSALNSGDTVMVEVDAFTSYAYFANNITITTPYGGIDASANTIELAIQSIESRKAPSASPTFTGIPTSPTAPLNTSNTWVATTAFVNNQLNSGGTYTHSISGNAGTVNNGVYTNQVYNDPSWITISKSKVGLGNVDNTADAVKSVAQAAIASVANTATALNPSNNYQVNGLWVGGGTPAYATNEIKAVGNITAYVSDERLKTKLGNIENALDKVEQLSGFYYELNDVAKALGLQSEGREVGVSAQQVLNVQPEAVAAAPVDNNYLTVRYERLVPLLIEAIKELRSEVNEIKGQIK